MNLTVCSKGVATLEKPSIALVPTVGAFEVVFQFSGTLHGMTDSEYRWYSIYGARLSVRDKGGKVSEIGKLEPDSPIILRQGDNAQGIHFSLKLAFHPYQIERLELLRDGGDLHFVLKLLARAATSKHQPDWEEHVSDWNVHIPESVWIAQFSAAGAGNILLFEVRMPSGGLRHPAEHHLLEAQRKLLEGNWRDCVSECRQFAEELGGQRANAALDKLATSRKLMTKSERGDAIVAAIQNYGHSATHSESRNGVLDYVRSDAKLMLSLAASLAEYYINQK